MTFSHGGVCSATGRTTELQQGLGDGDLGAQGGYRVYHLGGWDHGDTVNITGPSLSREVAGADRNIHGTAVAWEARDFGKVGHGQWFPGLSLFIHLAHGTSLNEAKLAEVVFLPLPA